MALSDLIEIVPLDKPVRAEITVPGSKSITNRALILAALADGEVTLTGALWSEDTQIMVECLQKLGFEIRVENDPEEFCNRTITVKGLAGKIPNGGTVEKPMELFVGNAGTAARFLSAFVCLGDGVYRLAGIPRMNERPKAALFQALRELGYRVESANDKLPAVIYGSGPKAGAKCTVNIEGSSQFASALLLSSKIGGWEVEIIGENAEESPYVWMTTGLIINFERRDQSKYFQIEPDESSVSYFVAAGWLFAPDRVDSSTSMSMTRTDTSLQIDGMFFNYFRYGGCVGLLDANSRCSSLSRLEDLADSIMTAIVIAPFAKYSMQFTDLARLRLQETERVVALWTELTKCGAKVVEEGDTLTVYPSQLHGAEIETYNDHRMAMCFAILGLKVPGIKIKNPACVKKTFPNFFQKLAAQPPHGLGATILDAKSGQKLTHEELFAE
jgi:3-phosphoshikimate 1-carboxyvinyltransferase